MKVNKTAASTCLQCPVGCGILITEQYNGNITISGDAANNINNGHLCTYGVNLLRHVNSGSDRPLYPHMRNNRWSPLEKVSWSQALLRASAVIKTLVQKHGSNTLAISLPNKSLLEERFLINKIMDQLNLPPAHPARNRYMNSAEASCQMALGEHTAIGQMPDIAHTDCFIIGSANLSIHHPVLWEKLKKNKAARPHAKLIYIGPSQNQLSDIADIHLQINPGTEPILNAAIARLLIESDAIDEPLIEKNTAGYTNYKEQIFSLSLQEAAVICGIDASDLELAAGYIQYSRSLATFLSKGPGLGATRVERNLSFINLHLITRQLFQPGSGITIIDDLALSADRIDNAAIKELFTTSRQWCDTFLVDERWELLNYYGISNNHTVAGFVDHLEKTTPRIIWLIHAETVYPKDEENRIKKALQQAKFVILQSATTRSPFYEYADLILPAANWYEKEGSSVNRSPVVPILKPKGEVRTDIDILLALAHKMGLTGFGYQQVAEILQEHDEVIEKPEQAARKNFTIHSLKNFYIFFESKQKRKELLLHIDYDCYFPEKKVPTLQVYDIVTLHPADAAYRKIKEGEIVCIGQGEQAIKAKAFISDKTKKGVMAMPLHLAKKIIFDSSENCTTATDLLNPHIHFISLVSRMEVKKYHKPTQKIAIVGAGAGALAFIRKYREYNTTDEIVVFSKEELPFYNRVLLPEYIADDQWNKLITLPEAEENEVGFHMHKGVSILHIDKEKKCITDSNNQQHTYDILILGMGSNAFIPPAVPHNWKGIYTIRSKRDVDRLRQQIKPGSKALIVGAGLVSLEVAGALKEINASVSILIRSSRLMDRQLDALGSDLLTEELEDRGINIFFNHEIRGFVGDGEIKGVLLNTGIQLDCDVLIYGVGTVPNIDLAKKAGLVCNRGVVVNDVMQTSDPAIFAIGEIVEWNRQLFGIVAAAEQQANIAAGYINGDTTQTYTGTLSANILKISGVNVCSIGINETPKDDPAYQEVIFIDKRLRHYKKCIIHNDKLAGAILIGDKTELMEFKDWMANDIFLEEKRDRILRGEGSKAEPVLGKLVCSCNNVGEGNIVNKINTGCTEFTKVCKITGAGTGCGSCRPEVKAILEKTLAG